MTSSVAPAGAAPMGGRLPPVFYFMAAAGAAGAGFLQLATPLIPALAQSFDVATGTAALLTAASQAGFVVGLIIILPRADRWGPRAAVVTTFALATIALTVFALLPSFGFAAACAVAIGISCVAPQLLTPLASAMAPSARRGAASSLVLSGILMGALASRVIAGFVGELSGWRSLFVGAAVVALVFAIASFVFLPKRAPAESSVANAAAVSPVKLWALWRGSALLRWHSTLAFLCSAANAGFWATYAIHLHNDFGYGASVAGLVGLVGIAGTFSAPQGGRLVDAGRYPTAFWLSASLLAAACLVNLVGTYSIVALVIGAAVLSAGGSMVHAANQASVLRLPTGSGQRKNSVYMVVFFAGSAAGTVIASTSYEFWGWTGSTLAGLTWILVAAVLFLCRPRGRTTH